MTAFVFALTLVGPLVSLIPASPEVARLGTEIRVACGVLAVERAMAHRLPAAPTAADVAERNALGEAARRAGMLTRLNPWAMDRIGDEMVAARAAAAAAMGTRDAAKEGERERFLTRLYMLVCAPK